MQQSDVFLDYLPFWLMSYTLAVVGWTCVGRFLLGLFVPPDSPNYIWRAFRALTEWAVRAVSVVTPLAVPGPLLVPITAVWVFFLRGVLGLAMLAAGMVPVIGPAAGPVAGGAG